MNCLAYIKYEGEDIANGVFGARDAANALSGIDKALRYYVEKEIPELRAVVYDFPVKIQEGSWEVLIPSNIDQLITVLKVGGAASFLYPYLKAMAEVAAKDGFFKTGAVKDVRQIISWAVLGIQLLIKYVKHMGAFDKNPKVSFSHGMDVVTVFNKDGIPFSFPVKFLNFILKCPPSLLSEMVQPIREKRTMKVGLYNADGELEETMVNNEERDLFCEEPQELDELPELVDGEHVALQGRVVRANEKEQSLGFQYNGHVITCKPVKGMTIASFKNGIISSRRGKLYQTDVKVVGVVERVTVDGRYKTRPRIFMSAILPVDDVSHEAEQSELAL